MKIDILTVAVLVFALGVLASMTNIGDAVAGGDTAAPASDLHQGITRD